MSEMIRQWEITVRKNGEFDTFLFVAENKELAHDHAMTLKYHPLDHELGVIMVSDNVNERVRDIAVRFKRWVYR